MGKKLVIASVFDRDSGILLYDTQIELAENEYLNVRVVDGSELEVFSNDGEVEFQGDVQGFTETRVKGFQFNEPTEQKEKPKKKKRNKKEE